MTGSFSIWKMYKTKIRQQKEINFAVFKTFCSKNVSNATIVPIMVMDMCQIFFHVDIYKEIALCKMLKWVIYVIDDMIAMVAKVAINCINAKNDINDIFDKMDWALLILLLAL